MRRIVVCCLFVAGIAACERICGDMQALDVAVGAGGDAGLLPDAMVGAGEGGVSSPSDGGEPSGGTSGGSEPSGGTNDGGSAGSVSSGTTGSTCTPPPSKEIIDFNDGLPSSALGKMVSDAGSPDGQIVAGNIDDNTSLVYHVDRMLSPPDVQGFAFRFKPCVDALLFGGIMFHSWGDTTTGAVEVSIITAANQSAPDSQRWVPFPAMSTMTNTVCLSLLDVPDPQSVLELRFRYVPPKAPSHLDVFLDNFTFRSEDCP